MQLSFCFGQLCYHHRNIERLQEYTVSLGLEYPRRVAAYRLENTRRSLALLEESSRCDQQRPFHLHQNHHSMPKPCCVSTRQDALAENYCFDSRRTSRRMHHGQKSSERQVRTCHQAMRTLSVPSKIQTSRTAEIRYELVALVDQNDWLIADHESFAFL